MASPPPFYILLANSSISNVPAGALSNTLCHPSVQYHYKDDSPLALLPHNPDEHVLVLDFDPLSSTNAAAQSISKSLAVTALRMEEAPGTVATEDNGSRNDTMFIIETTTNDHATSLSHPERQSAQAALAQFKHRNTVLRRALVYPPKRLSPPTPLMSQLATILDPSPAP